MATNQQKFFDQVDKGTTGFIERLAEAVRIPSVSSDPAHENDVKAMDAWLKEKLHSLGVSIDSPPSEVPSLVLGRIKGIEGSTKTVLVYGHYDVQPADAKGWASQNADSPNPFSPTRIVKGDTDKLVGRGTTDDKGPVTGWLNVLEAHKKLGLKLPVNIQFLFEGRKRSGMTHSNLGSQPRRKSQTGFSLVLIAFASRTTTGSIPVTPRSRMASEVSPSSVLKLPAQQTTSTRAYTGA